MYNHSNLLSCMRGLIGFDRPYVADYPELDADMTSSASGIFVNSSLHPLLNYDNIWAIAEHFDRVSVKVWSSGITYKTGDIVKEGATYYRSLQDSNTGNQPSVSATYWSSTNLLSAYLRRVYDGSVLKLFNRLYTEKKINQVAKTLHANVSLYEGVGNISGRIVKSGRLVGFKIDLLNPDTIAILSRIALQVDQAQNPINLYLFHSSSVEPLQTFSLNQTKSVSIQWHKLATPETLAFLSDSVNAGGSYYLVYYENELNGSAVKKDVYFDGRLKCGTCSESAATRRLYNQWGKFLKIQPFYVNAADLPGGTVLWDEENEFYVEDSNWGINLQLSIQCDIVNWTCNNSQVITNALTQQLVVDLLNEMAFSMRDNQKREKLAGMAAVALDNQENGQYGEAKKLEKAIQALSFDFSDLSPACLPCENHNRQSHLRSVWRP